MEAVRILKAIGIAPKRPIRIALWSGEEEGLLGSRAYAAQHFGSRPLLDESESSLPSSMQKRGPPAAKPQQAKGSPSFHPANGTGKIRGLLPQENGARGPIFQGGPKPSRDLGATTVTMR